MNARFAQALLGWKPSKKNKLGWALVPNSADSDNAGSLKLAAGMLDALEVQQGTRSAVPGSPGKPLEDAVRGDLEQQLRELHPDRSWRVERGVKIAQFDQYVHLNELHQLVKSNPDLRITIGTDYLIEPDVTVALDQLKTASDRPLLHAAISCKWTIRSDRVQNIRHEFLQMIRHRRGRQPHLVTVTAEPLPTRLAAIARGTGEVDAVYHIAYDALAASVAANANTEQSEAWHEVTGQRRLLDYGLLLETLASG
ncbi:NgoMIV family type II restriction endonuclease [Amycolatopsis sp. YIM 10]|uniref:NgoMIV family type II restriction endonuclease n=1 Tax=Amycolatopsis sp. YIM 10 TaxID=2653857 RepID=UPI00128FD26F|nr:NgoMIV family type II restriction endonuclease [Amycolatopsis sp. YIM 10]QFU85538.1 Type-2 restriction enzyme NgoMIV [Amycolatopsis sp. YIM 10]